MFEAAIRQMDLSGLSDWGPISFQEYCRANGVAAKRTAEFISVDNHRSLAPELKRAQCMVFRLGSPKGERNTHFGLSKCGGGWEDFFLMDKLLFAKSPQEVFIPTVSFRHLFPFYLLPSFTESSLVSLALASGLMAHALELDELSLPLAAATGQSTHTFHFRPRAETAKPWLHSKGQVEIDSLFAARRQGKETVFIVESKAAGELNSLAKHKLVYPLLAIRESVPHHMTIVPVYLRAVQRTDGCHFYVAECKLEEPADGGAPVLSHLHAVSVKHFVLQMLPRGSDRKQT